MLCRVTIPAQQLKVIEVECEFWIINRLCRERYLMVYVFARCYLAVPQALLT
jgi:hypothetical protein